MNQTDDLESAKTKQTSSSTADLSSPPPPPPPVDEKQDLILETTKFISQQSDPDALSHLSAQDEKKNPGGGGGGGLRKDLKTIILLMYLYFMQGLPLGLAGSMPFILSSRKVTFSDQGTFSFVFWPFSMKLLWAPIVDSLFFKRFGRRKSWLVPVQLLIGILMLSLANVAQGLLYGIHGDKG